uniref:Uncharacterized protein n=1 Tax=Rhizophagus irregularis (strain DAOM 181602 / DAOM 197198 / MUCL 43194) TaxID=747089 RepID=U9UJJ1_RHIID
MYYEFSAGFWKNQVDITHQKEYIRSIFSQFQPFVKKNIDFLENLYKQGYFDTT